MHYLLCKFISRKYNYKNQTVSSKCIRILLPPTLSLICIKHLFVVFIFKLFHGELRDMNNFRFLILRNSHSQDKTCHVFTGNNLHCNKVWVPVKRGSTFSSQWNFKIFNWYFLDKLCNIVNIFKNQWNDYCKLQYCKSKMA